MNWNEKFADGTTGVKSSKEYDSKKESLSPLAAKEAQQDKGIDPIEFQPVKSPGNYEAEFAKKDDDVIFHFWPWGFHDAQDKGTTPPRFKNGFETFLTQVMAEQYGAKRIQLEKDLDMGALFVRAMGASSNQFFREVAIKACELLHQKFES